MVFIDFFHESRVLLRFSGVNGFGPSSLAMVHALISSTNANGVDLMHRKVSDVVEFNKVGISQDVVLILEMIFSSRIEGSANGRSICECWRPSELSSSSRVLIKLCHDNCIT